MSIGTPTPPLTPYQVCEQVTLVAGKVQGLHDELTSSRTEAARVNTLCEELRSEVAEMHVKHEASKAECQQLHAQLEAMLAEREASQAAQPPAEVEEQVHHC